MQARAFFGLFKADKLRRMEKIDCQSGREANSRYDTSYPITGRLLPQAYCQAWDTVMGRPTGRAVEQEKVIR
jgi:hypothetical protein